MPLQPTYRQGTMDDQRAAYDVFVAALADFDRRKGTPEDENVWIDAAFIVSFWERRRPLFDHLAATAEQFWVAELDGQVVGYARTTLHDGVRELTEFFVHPDRQAAGVGRELLARAFPVAGARRRVIIATFGISALSRYLKAGVYGRFAIYRFARKPETVSIETDLTFEAADDSPDTLAAPRSVDAVVLGFSRDADHGFLQRDRRLFLARRGAATVGYCYVGRDSGPMAVLDETDFPAVLAHAESEAAANGIEEFGLEVPLINRAAIDHLLERGFRLDEFAVRFMSDEPFGRFEQYIFTSPPFFI